MEPILPIGRNNPDVAPVQPVERRVRREEEADQRREQRRRDARREQHEPPAEPEDGSHIDVRA